MIIVTRAGSYYDDGGDDDEVVMMTTIMIMMAMVMIMIMTVMMILTMIMTMMVMVMMIVTVLVMLLLCWQLMDGTLIGPIQPKILHTLAFQQYIYNHFVKEKKKRRQVQFVESEGRFLQQHSLIHNNSN